jgi:hypothetical protein
MKAEELQTLQQALEDSRHAIESLTQPAQAGCAQADSPAQHAPLEDGSPVKQAAAGHSGRLLIAAYRPDSQPASRATSGRELGAASADAARLPRQYTDWPWAEKGRQEQAVEATSNIPAGLVQQWQDLEARLVQVLGRDRFGKSGERAPRCSSA